MNFKAKKLSEYHKFTKGELHQILADALKNEKQNYWDKPYTGNPIFNNGWYFNWCKKLIEFTEETKDEIVTPIISQRILEKYMKYSKIQIPEKKRNIELKHIENPFL